MSRLHSAAFVQPQSNPANEDDRYFQEGESPSLISFSDLTRDRVCTHCGLWKSEHDFDVCSTPNFV